MMKPSSFPSFSPAGSSIEKFSNDTFERSSAFTGSYFKLGRGWFMARPPDGDEQKPHLREERHHEYGCADTAERHRAEPHPTVSRERGHRAKRDRHLNEGDAVGEPVVM